MAAAAVTAVTAAAALVAASVASAPVAADPPPTLAEVQQRVDAMHEQAAAADERYNAAADALAEVQRRVERAEGEVGRQQERVDQLSASLGSFAAMTYRSGGIDPGLQTLMADDPREFMAAAAQSEAYAEQQTSQIQVVARARQDVAEARAEAQDEVAERTRLRDTMSAEKASFEGLLREQEALLAKLTAEEQARLEAEQERQRAAARAARDQARAQLAAHPAAEEPVAEEAEPDRPAVDVPVSGRAAAAVEAALSRIGSPYSYGSAGPNAFDCSGLTSWAWAQAGVSLPRSSGGQAGLDTQVSADELQPGDVLYYGSPVSHVALYIGDGQVVHASNPRTDVVIAPAMQAGGSSKPFRGAVRPG
jgi:cell wall-associated NlpC family hydrolase